MSFTSGKSDDERARLVGGTVRNLILSIRPTWERLSVANAFFLGFALGLALGVVPHVVFGRPVMIPGFLVYFPFHVWLCYLAFSVLLSSVRRADIMGEGYSPIGAFFGYLLTTKYGLFCISWFFTMWLYWVSIIGI
ncbi:hypothetical protein [Rhodovulum sp. FJ3]|uniref:hypothetical protein n=1 Tax=Rhodovulum sp. FJ3 TaxID=3079053 RepID=UPI00293DC136|nr:hypothetical protein [Rhodovulum sp. FJ3]MDV4169649.1 hypothetical protein [Rhodovulum sp. FJ3]